jgi:hypothetical protein
MGRRDHPPKRYVSSQFYYILILTYSNAGECTKTHPSFGCVFVFVAFPCPSRPTGPGTPSLRCSKTKTKGCPFVLVFERWRDFSDHTTLTPPLPRPKCETEGPCCPLRLTFRAADSIFHVPCRCWNRHSSEVWSKGETESAEHEDRRCSAPSRIH